MAASSAAAAVSTRRRRRPPPRRRRAVSEERCIWWATVGGGTAAVCTGPHVPPKVTVPRCGDRPTTRDGDGSRLTLTRQTLVAPTRPPSSLPARGELASSRAAIQTPPALLNKTKRKACVAVVWWPACCGLSNQNQSLPTACIKLEGSDRLLEGRVKHTISRQAGAQYLFFAVIQMRIIVRPSWSTTCCTVVVVDTNGC
ncbi:hypothetical protein BST61_g9831 [Cercospora zeina]